MGCLCGTGQENRIKKRGKEEELEALSISLLCLITYVQNVEPLLSLCLY